MFNYIFLGARDWYANRLCLQITIIAVLYIRREKYLKIYLFLEMSLRCMPQICQYIFCSQRTRNWTASYECVGGECIACTLENTRSDSRPRPFTADNICESVPELRCYGARSASGLHCRRGIKQSKLGRIIKTRSRVNFSFRRGFREFAAISGTRTTGADESLFPSSRGVLQFVLFLFLFPWQWRVLFARVTVPYLAFKALKSKADSNIGRLRELVALISWVPLFFACKTRSGKYPVKYSICQCRYIGTWFNFHLIGEPPPCNNIPW